MQVGSTVDHLSGTMARSISARTMLVGLEGQMCCFENATQNQNECLNRGGAHIRRRLSRTKKRRPHVRGADWPIPKLSRLGKDKNLVSKGKSTEDLGVLTRDHCARCNE